MTRDGDGVGLPCRLPAPDNGRLYVLFHFPFNSCFFAFQGFVAGCYNSRFQLVLSSKSCFSARPNLLVGILGHPPQLMTRHEMFWTLWTPSCTLAGASLTV